MANKNDQLRIDIATLQALLKCREEEYERLDHKYKTLSLQQSIIQHLQASNCAMLQS